MKKFSLTDPEEDETMKEYSTCKTLENLEKERERHGKRLDKEFRHLSTASTAFEIDAREYEDQKLYLQAIQLIQGQVPES